MNDGARWFGFLAALAFGLTPWPACSAQHGQVVELPQWQGSGRAEVYAHLEQAMGERRVLMFGELHGTVEAPELLAGFVAFLRERGRQVVVALELPHTEQALLDSADRQEMQTLAERSAFWRGVRDGRSSEAVMEAIASIRAGGAPIVAFDVDHPEGLSRSERMARYIRETVERADGKTVVTFGGNFHTAPPSISQTNMVSQLQDIPALIVNLTARRGSHWGCVVGEDGRPSCGLQEFRRHLQVDTDAVTISVEDERAGSVFLSFRLPEHHASPPLLGADG